MDQGDGLAPVLFAFGMKQAAEAFRSALVELSRQLSDSAPVLVLLYLDDIITYSQTSLCPDLVKSEVENKI